MSSEPALEEHAKQAQQKSPEPSALEQLMIPGAPAGIKANYISLASRAEDYRFALVEPEIGRASCRERVFQPV
jgi:hypothetical protein